MLKKTKDFISNGKGKVLAAVSAGIVIAVAGVITVVCMTGAAKSGTVSSKKALAASSDSCTYTVSAISSEPNRICSQPANVISAVIGAKTQGTSQSSVSYSKPVDKSEIQTNATLKSTNYSAQQPKTPSNKVTNSNPYKGYTQLDMSNFSIGNAVYSPDGAGSRCTLFENKVVKSSNQHWTSFGAPYVSLGSTALYYEEGRISLSNLKKVLLNSKKYISGFDGHYIVTGIYDNSGISYTRPTAASYSQAKNQNAGIFNQISKKGFRNNPYSSALSYSDGCLCTKISEGSSRASQGYVRAIIFTLKKI